MAKKLKSTRILVQIDPAGKVRARKLGKKERVVEVVEKPEIIRQAETIKD